MSIDNDILDPAKDAQHVAAVLAQGGFKVAVAAPGAAKAIRQQLGASAPLALPAPTVMVVQKARRHGLTEAMRLLRSDEDAAPAVPPPAASVPARLASQVRRVSPMPLALLTPAVVTGARPRFEMADPKLLLVDEAYQRNLSEKSLRLIRKIIAEWDWCRFKPPVVAETAAGLEVLDGQHTATAAASHPTVGFIPVMVVPGVSQADRAHAFVGHNRDRLGMTAMQIHYAQVTAGDAEAVEIQAVCAASRVEILRTPPAGGAYKPGQTVAVAAIDGLIERRGRDRAIEILTILTDAGLGPVNAVHVRAVDHLLHDPEYRDHVSPAGMVQALAGLLPTLAGEASVFAATHRVPVWKATASVIFRKAKGRRLSGAVQ